VAEEPATEAPATEAPATEAPAAEGPTSLKIGNVVAGTLEEAWYSTHIDSQRKLQESNPYGVEIEIDYTENIWGEDSLQVMREYAEAGYDIVWSHTGADSDYIMQLQDDYPDVLFAHSGGGGTPLGKNSVHTWSFVHEATYLEGMIAGMMTESDVIGFVGSFPSEEVNAEANSYIQGARDVNPDVEVKVTFINSWFDPDKAKEAAVAQMAAGADFILPTIFGAYEAMDEAGIKGFGNYVDQSSMAPEVILASALLSWDDPAAHLLDLWWGHATTGEPYDVPAERYYVLMSEGGTNDLHVVTDMLPEEVLAAVEAKKAEILAGDFVVEMDESEPVSDQ
jgi:basic membrane lipoprotein Med (substrate-binding protein (PBP1-ABC) superfamily)